MYNKLKFNTYNKIFLTNIYILSCNAGVNYCSNKVLPPRNRAMFKFTKGLFIFFII